jgi:hypothetical protein
VIKKTVWSALRVLLLNFRYKAQMNNGKEEVFHWQYIPRFFFLQFSNPRYEAVIDF